MNAYEKLIAKKKKGKNVFKVVSEFNEQLKSEIDYKNDNKNVPPVEIQLKQHKKLLNINIPQEPQIYLKNQLKIISQNNKTPSVEVNKEFYIQNNETKNQSSKKQIFFQQYEPDEDQSPIDKLDGIQEKLQTTNFFKNINNLLGNENIRTNEGFWRIIQIGDNYQRNLITISRFFLSIYKILPKIILSRSKIYWLIAIILSFFFQSNKSSSYLITVWIFNIFMELFFTLIHLRGRYEQAEALDQREVIKYNRNLWIKCKYDELQTGDIIKVESQAVFPCDCLILSCKSKRLIYIDESINNGKSNHLNLKLTVLPYNTFQVPLKGTIYLKNDKSYFNLNKWKGKLNINTQIFNIDFRNFACKNSINMQQDQLICVVIYTSINNKILEQVQYPKLIKQRKITSNLEKMINICITIHIITSIIEGIASYLFQTYIVNNLSYLPQQNATTSFAAMQIAKYFIQFIIIVPIFAKLLYDIYVTISCKITIRDPIFENSLIINDEQAIPELGQTKVIISKPLTLFKTSAPSLKLLRTKDIEFQLGSTISQQKISTIKDFLSAAHLSCQQIEQSPERQSIIKSGKTFGINLDFNENTVKLKQNNSQITVELLHEIPKTQQRRFNLTFYRQSSKFQILCIIRGESQPLLQQIFQNINNNEYIKQITKIEKMNNCYSEILGKLVVSPQILAQIIKNYEDNSNRNDHIKNLNESINKIIANIEILGYLYYASPFRTQTRQLLDIFHQSGITNIMLCNKQQSRFLLSEFNKYPIETLSITDTQLEEDGLHAQFNFRKECRILSSQNFSKILYFNQNNNNKLSHLIRIIKTVSLIIITNSNLKDITFLLQALKKQKQIVIVGVANCNQDLHLLKYTDVGICISMSQNNGDLNRYADIKLTNLKQFLKLIFIHSKDNYCGSSKLLIFLFQKNLMIFICELIYSFYSLSTDVILIPVIYQYLLEILLLSITPVVYFLFENQFDYDTIMMNPQLFKIGNTNSLLNLKYFFKRSLVTFLEAITLTFILLYFLDSSSNGLSGFIKGHQFTGYIIFFNIYHISLFKLFFFKSGFRYYQILVIILSIPLYYIVMVIISLPSISYYIDIHQRNIFSHAFSVKNYVAGIFVIIECLSIELLILLNNNNFKLKLKKERNYKVVATFNDIEQQQIIKKRHEKQKNMISYEKLLIQNLD